MKKTFAIFAAACLLAGGAMASEELAKAKNCLTCHAAGKVGALPQDHETRAATECLLCHATPANEAPIGMRPLVRLN